jgi:hypothetical protein
MYAGAGSNVLTRTVRPARCSTESANGALLAEAFENIYDLLIAHGSLPRPADRP